LKKVNFYPFLVTRQNFLIFACAQMHLCTNTKVQLHTLISYELFFVIPSKFLVFHPCFQPLHLQSYNYNCTIHLLQLQNYILQLQKLWSVTH